MDPEMFAKLHEHKNDVSRSGSLPEETKEGMELFLAPILEIEKEDYESTLVPFKQYERQLRLQAEVAYTEFYQLLCHGQDLLKEKFTEEDQKVAPENPESSYVVWEKISKGIRELIANPEENNRVINEKAADAVHNDSIQQYLGVPWPFMDRACRYATQLLHAKHYADAHDVYHFLRYLNSEVFEYWLGEAICLQYLGNFEDALRTYGFALLLEPDSAVAFFQMANCYLELDEEENCKTALKFCIEYAQNNSDSEELLKYAEELQRQLASL